MLRPLRRYVESVENHRPPRAEIVDRWLASALDERTLARERRVAPEDGLAFVAEWLVRRVRDKKDAIVVVTGERGVGKSILVLRLGLMVAKLLRRPWNWSDDYISSASDLLAFYLRVLDGSRLGEQGWIDEGGRVLFNRDFGTVQSKAVVRVFTQIREISAITYLCVPSLDRLDVAVRADLACLWVACRKRGLARVHLRDNRLRYEPESNYGFAAWPRCPHLTWKPFPSKSKIEAQYLAVKRSALREGVVEAGQMVARANARNAGEGPTEGERRAHRERNRRYYKNHNPGASERPAARRG